MNSWIQHMVDTKGQGLTMAQKRDLYREKYPEGHPKQKSVCAGKKPPVCADPCKWYTGKKRSSCRMLAGSGKHSVEPPVNNSVRMAMLAVLRKQQQQ